MLSEEHVQARDSARRFADEAIRPIAAELDESERFPEEIYRAMAELGLFGITVPAELGGAGMDALAYALVMEELSRGYASVADQCGLVELVGTLLTRYGTDAPARALAAAAAAGASGAAPTPSPRPMPARTSRASAPPPPAPPAAGGSMAASCGSTTRRSATSPWSWRAPTRRPGTAA